jgi:hypothetical protein
MSHIVSIATQVKDEQAVRAACTRLGLAQPEHKTVRLFSASATGLCVTLPGWSYPLVCDLATGTLAYDNFSGAWGEQKHLDAFVQRYSAEKVRIEARKKGHTCSESLLADGSIRLTVHVGGAA